MGIVGLPAAAGGNRRRARQAAGQGRRGAGQRRHPLKPPGVHAGAAPPAAGSAVGGGKTRQEGGQSSSSSSSSRGDTGATAARGGEAAHTLPLMQRAREVIRSSDPTRQADDAARWSAAFSLAKRMASGGGGGTSSSDLSTSSSGRQGPSQAMLLLFLLAVGHLRIKLQLDMVRFWPGLLGKPQLTVAEVKTNLADLAKARRQLETEVAVLELAHHLSRQQAPDPFSALRWQEAWERPSLDAKAYVCGVLDGKALAAREDLAEDLQVPLADLPGAAAPRMWVPLKVFRFGTRGILTADDDL